MYGEVPDAARGGLGGRVRATNVTGGGGSVTLRGRVLLRAGRPEDRASAPGDVTAGFLRPAPALEGPEYARSRTTVGPPGRGTSARRRGPRSPPPARGQPVRDVPRQAKETLAGGGRTGPLTAPKGELNLEWIPASGIQLRKAGVQFDAVRVDGAEGRQLAS